MGLFDGWQFDPSTYGQGGLLGQLANMTQLAQAPAASQAGASIFPQPTPDYGQTANVVGSLGQMAVPTFGQADQTALPQNAQPAQYQPPQPQPGIGDRLLAGLQGFGEGGRSGGLIGAFAGSARGLSEGSAPQNQTEQALVAKGLDRAIAKQVARDPAAMRALLPTLLGNTGQTDDIKEYTFAKREDPSLTFEKFMARKKSVSGEYGMTPIWGTGPDGKPAVLQLGKSGDAKQSVLPQGFSLARDPIKVEGPTGTTILDPQTRQQVGFIPKDITAAKIAEAKGEAQGAAQVALPQVLANAEQTLATIQSIKTDPYRERGTGASSLFNFVPGTGGYDFAQKVEQLKGKTFLEAFQSLKGGGAITEMEGRKAENAIARLSVAQSEGAFMEALNELETVVKSGIERSKQKAGMTGANASPQSSSAPAATGYKVIQVR